jgi:two-component system, chemotaxis family, protein-glutamate methylesterase/glutaminase
MNAFTESGEVKKTPSSATLDHVLVALRERPVSAAVVGASAGGISALDKLLPMLPASTPFPVTCVLHLPPYSRSLVSEIFSAKCKLIVKEAESTERLRPGHVYFAPPGYHLSIEADQSFSLSLDHPVSFSRPAIDVLFESAARAYGANLLGILLTGANSDGAAGLQHIKARGGFTIVQDPASAEFPTMPGAALARFRPDYVGDLPALTTVLATIAENKQG